MMLKDENGQPSITRTLYALGFVIACVKLMFSGMTLGGFNMSQFSGVDFAAVMAALGGVYHLGKIELNKNKSKE